MAHSRRRTESLTANKHREMISSLVKIRLNVLALGKPHTDTAKKKSKLRISSATDTKLQEFCTKSQPTVIRTGAVNNCSRYSINDSFSTLEEETFSKKKKLYTAKVYNYTAK